MNQGIEESVERTTRRKKFVIWAIVIIFFYGLGLRLAYVESAIILVPIRRDAKRYVTIAENLNQYGIYSSDKTAPLHNDTFISPGYPLFLASILKITPDFIFGYVTVQRIQALISAVTSVLIFLIGLEILPLGGAFLAGCLMLLSPHAVIMSGYLLTETLFTFLLYGALLCLIIGFRKNSLWWYMGFGILAGLASLMRPALLLFPFLVVILIWLYLPAKQRLKTSCIMLLAFVLLQAPWFYWKNAHAVTGGISPAAASLALGIYPDLVYKDAKLRGFPYKEDPQYDEMSRDAETAISILLQRARNKPFTYLKWYLFEKPVMFWSWSLIVGMGGPFVLEVLSSIYSKYQIVEYSMVFSKWMHPVLLISACFIILFLLGGLLKSKQPPCKGPGIWVITSLFLYFTAIHTVLAPLPRYSIPLHGDLFLLGTCGFVLCIDFVRKKLLPFKSKIPQ